MTNVAIIGGGPGGLFTAHLLEKKYGGACRATLFEATGRSGGKIRTLAFDSAPILYEAGVAECYDYSHSGFDRLRQLVAGLGLNIVPTAGEAVVLDGHVLAGDSDLQRHYGEEAVHAIQEFRRQASAMLPIRDWCESCWQYDNSHPWSCQTYEEVLNQVTHPAARRYLEVAAHSDLATEPHLTNGLNGLKNVLMDVPGYVAQYAIEGGMEELPRRLRQSLTRTRIELNSPVQRVEPDGAGNYSLHVRSGSSTTIRRDFDAVFIALPHNQLSGVEFGGERLRRAMESHIAYYDRPGRYLRVSILFRKPFWRPLIAGSWFMLDAFGGCCVYDEGTRHPESVQGVLGWLLAGTEALLRCDLEDACLIDLVLDSLPDSLRGQARENLLEGRVHRWAAAVSGQPGGLPVRDPGVAHQPEPSGYPGLFLVGDYLFDSTLNGVLDSAHTATDLLASRLSGQSLAAHSSPALLTRQALQR